MIILYHPRAAEQRFRIPLSVLTVASILIDDHDVRIVDGDLSRDPLADIRRHLREARGRAYLGVSVMPGPQLARAIPHTRELKREFPDLPVIWGGWFPSLHTDTVLGAAFVDFVVRGRGEASFPLLLKRIAEGGPFDDIPNLSWRDHDGTHRHNPEAPYVHPDKLPRLPYHLVDVKAYHQPTWLGSRTTGYHSSYGCPLKCGFCAVAALYNGRWLGQSVPRMMQDLEPLLDHGANALEFFDNNFFVNERRCREFADTLRGRGVNWWGEGTIDGLMSFKDETLRAMRDSGLRMLFFGAESGSDAVLELMNKGGLKTSTTLALARRFRDFDIVPEFSFVLGNPQAPHDDIEASFELIRRLKEAHPTCEIILYLYSPEPFQKAELWAEAQKKGFKFPEKLEEWEADPERLFNLRRKRETPWLSPEDVARVRDFETVLNAWSPGVTDIKLGPRSRRVLHALAAPRYLTRQYRNPLVLRYALKALRYRRVEQEGL